MVKAVIDPSALVDFLLKKGQYEKVRGVLLEGAESVELLLYDVVNYLKEEVKKGNIKEENAKKIIKALNILSGTNIKFRHETDILERCFELSLTEDISAYDSAYLVLALKLNLPMLSFDKRKQNIARKNSIPVID